MPFEADKRCLPIRVELNLSYVWELIEQITEKEIDPDYELDNYVLELENYLSWYVYNKGLVSFKEWFLENYDYIEEWIEVQDALIITDCKNN